MSRTLRTFIAVDLALTPPLRSVLRELNEMGRAIRAVTPDNLHITLKFLGEINASLLRTIDAVISEVASRYEAFDMTIEGLGAFPKTERPTVIWAGLNHAEPLIKFASELTTDLKSLGFPPERRPLHPHVTLARVKSKPPPEYFALMANHEETPFGHVAVEAIKLYQSELKKTGPVYSVMNQVSLA